MATNILRNFVFSAFLVSAIFTYYVSAEETVHWRYFGIYGVQNWSASFTDCNAKNHTRQSPVDIVNAETEVNTNLPQINLVVDGAINGPVTIVNNGHTVNLDFIQTSIHISGGGLNGKFRVGGVHFHWGNGYGGSEHDRCKAFFLWSRDVLTSWLYVVSMAATALILISHCIAEVAVDLPNCSVTESMVQKMHVVTYDESRYPGVIEASHGVNSIAVLSVLFQVSTDDNAAFNPFVSHLPRVTIAGQPTTIPYFDLQALLPQNKFRYYRYLGSLTTPPCSESVVWSVFEGHPSISSRQLAEFRKLQELTEPDGTIDFLIDNWRMTQPLYDRKIQRSFSEASGTELGFNVLSQIALIGTMGVVVQLLFEVTKMSL